MYMRADDNVDVLWPSSAPLQDLIAANQGRQEIAEQSSAGGQREISALLTLQPSLRSLLIDPNIGSVIRQRPDF